MEESEDQYQALKKVLLDNDGIVMLTVMAHSGPFEEQDMIVECLHMLYSSARALSRFLSVCFVHTLFSNPDATTLFRETGPAIALLKHATKRCAREYLFDCLGDPVQEIASGEPLVNETPTEEHIQSITRLRLAVDCILHSVYASARDCPPLLSEVAMHLRENLRQYFRVHNSRSQEDVDELALSRLCSLYFLRIFVPAICHPTSFGVVLEEPSSIGSRNLVLCCKAIQAVANGTDYAEGEVFAQLNRFLCSHRPLLHSFIASIADAKRRTHKASSLPKVIKSSGVLQRSAPQLHDGSAVRASSETGLDISAIGSGCGWSVFSDEPDGPNYYAEQLLSTSKEIKLLSVIAAAWGNRRESIIKLAQSTHPCMWCVLGENRHRKRKVSFAADEHCDALADDEYSAGTGSFSLDVEEECDSVIEVLDGVALPVAANSKSFAEYHDAYVHGKLFNKKTLSGKSRRRRMKSPKTRPKSPKTNPRSPRLSARDKLPKMKGINVEVVQRMQQEMAEDEKKPYGSPSMSLLSQFSPRNFLRIGRSTAPSIEDVSDSNGSSPQRSRSDDTVDGLTAELARVSLHYAKDMAVLREENEALRRRIAVLEGLLHSNGVTFAVEP